MIRRYLQRCLRAGLHGLFALGVLASFGAQAASTRAADEGDLRGQLAAATWPADIVRLADQWLRDHPQAGWAADERRHAAATQALLAERDVHLFRSAFQSDAASAERHADLRRAALGDGASALRIAHLHRADAHRYVGWLQLATRLGDRSAAYELAVYFRTQDQPLFAAAYETRAIDLGYQPPASLDNVRK